jgi:hypothetical protein
MTKQNNLDPYSSRLLTQARLDILQAVGKVGTANKHLTNPQQPRYL